MEMLDMQEGMIRVKILIMAFFKEDGMMKAIFRLAASVAAISMVALSCAKIEQPTAPVDTETEIENPADGDFTVTFECSMPDGEETKTTFNEDQSEISWSNGDVLRFYQYAYTKENSMYEFDYRTRTLSKSNLIDSKTTNFSVTSNFKDPEINSNKKGYYYSIYPHGQYGTSSFLNGEMWCRLTLPSNQTPTTVATFDPEADLLISELKVVEQKPSSIQLQYTHAVAFGKMTIKNLQSSNPVKTIEFSAKKGENDVPVAGTRYYNINEGVADEQKTDDKCSEEHKITLNYTSDDAIASGDGFTAYFCCYPFELGNGDSFKVVVTTTAGEIFTKNVSLQGKQGLAFNQSKGSIFSVDMATATKTCSWFKLSKSSTPSTYNTVYGLVQRLNNTTIFSVKRCLVLKSDYPAITDLDNYVEENGTSLPSTETGSIASINSDKVITLSFSNCLLDTEYILMVKAVDENSNSIILTQELKTAWFGVKAVASSNAGKVNGYFYGANLESMNYKMVNVNDLAGKEKSEYENYFNTLSTSDGTSMLSVINSAGSSGKGYAFTVTSGNKYILMAKATNTKGESMFVYSSEATAK